jgi:hypothetical protein
MDGRVIYDEHHKVLICLQHQCAITTGWVERHFRAEHGDCPLTTRRQIVEDVTNLETGRPNEIIYTTDAVPPVLHLKTYTGYRCNDGDCSELTGTTGSMMQHCRVKHSWTSKKGSGWIEVPVQTFFQGKHRRYYNRLLMLTVVISKSPKGIC